MSKPISTDDEGHARLHDDQFVHHWDSIQSVLCIFPQIHSLHFYCVCVPVHMCLRLSIWEKVLEKEIEKGGMTLGQSVTDHRCGRIITLFKQCLILEKSLPSSASVSVSLRKGTDSVIWTS